MLRPALALTGKCQMLLPALASRRAHLYNVEASKDCRCLPDAGQALGQQLWWQVVQVQVYLPTWLLSKF